MKRLQIITQTSDLVNENSQSIHLGRQVPRLGLDLLQDVGLGDLGGARLPLPQNAKRPLDLWDGHLASPNLPPDTSSLMGNTIGRDPSEILGQNDGGRFANQQIHFPAFEADPLPGTL